MSGVRRLKQAPILRQFVFLLGTTFSFALIVAIKIPFAFSNFWAEDGAFYQQALDNSFPKDFLISGGGYVIFISRIVANLVTLGTIGIAPIINVLVVITVLGFIVQRLYINLEYLIKNRTYKLLVCLSVVLLPINNVETIASGTALHFQLLFVSLVITLAARRKASIFKIDILVLSIALLSDPFAIMTLIPLIIRRGGMAVAFWRHKLGSAVLLVSSMSIQLTMITIFQLKGGRTLGNSHSLIKTSYLFLDRVIGSTFIPNWGFVTSESFVGERVTSQMIGRALIGLICASLIAIYVVKHLRKNLVHNEIHSKVMLLWLIVLPTLYWLITGIMFNPEPRYAVFPGLALLLAVLILFDHLLCEGMSLNNTDKLCYFIVIFMVLTWILSASPSSRRVDGPSWHNEIINARLECKSSRLDTVSVKILPTDHNWKIQLQCQSVMRNFEVE